MPTANYTASATFQPVASGPGLVNFTFNYHAGRWTVHTSTDPAGITASHEWVKGLPLERELASGEHLHVRGRGVVTVSAATLVT